MLNEDRVKVMTKLAMYEENEGKEDFKISAYYRKDYAGYKTIVTMIWVTVGYVIAAALAGLAFMDTLMNHMSLTGFIVIAAVAVGIYLVLITVYGIRANNFYQLRHNKARQRVKKYNRELIHLEKLYKKETR